MLVRVLGVLGVDADVAIGTGQAARLLGILALHAGEPVPASELAEEVLGSDRASKPTEDLYVVVSRVRARLRSAGLPISLKRDNRGYRLEVQATDVDACVFESLVDDARRADDPIDRVGLYRRALALWRGPVLAGLDVGVQPLAVRLERLRESTSEELLVCRLTTEPILEVLPDALAEATRHPTSEGLAEVAIKALDAVGRRDEALAHYEQLRRRLASELGIAPSGRLEQLHTRLLAGQGSVETATPGNLGPSPTELVGRTADQQDLERFVERHRLTTVVGTGGVGKTTLALAVGHAMSACFPGGVWICELASVGPNATDLDGPLASSMGVIRVPGRSLLESIAAVIGRRRTLLILDNCEHVLPQAGVMADALLRLAPAVTVLATSREPLCLHDEHLFVVDPLPTDTAAVTLFETRARQVLSSFAVDGSNRAAVTSICRRLDGLPLAIELAAARMRAMTPTDLDDRLDDFRLLRKHAGVDRHRTLEATIDWSLQSLSEAERRCFDVLAVFTGSFDLAAAESVMRAFGDPPFETDEHLAALVARSLVIAAHTSQGARYRMLDTMRHVGRAHLADGETLTAALEAHASWCRQHVAHLGSTYMTGASGQVATRFLADAANIRAAVDHAITSGDLALGIDLIRPLDYLAVWTMQFEVARWASRVAQLPGAESHAEIGELLGIAALVQWFEGDHPHAAELARSALELAARHGSRTYWASYALASLEMTEGRLEAAQNLLADEVERTMRPIDRAYLLYGLATICSLGIEPQVPDPAAECLRLAGSAGSAAMTAAGLQAVAVTELGHGNAADVLDRFRRARQAAEDTGAGIFEVIAAAGMLGRIARSNEPIAADDASALVSSLTRGRSQGNANGCWACIEPAIATAWRLDHPELARRLREGLRHNIWGARWGNGRTVRIVDAGTTDAQLSAASDSVDGLNVFDLIDLIVAFVATFTRKTTSPDLVFLERVTGIEPAFSAWEADVLPLNYTRVQQRREASNSAPAGEPRIP